MSETTTGGGNDAVRPLQAPHGPCLTTAEVAMIQGMADYWSGHPLPPQMQAFLTCDVPALVASHAALTARLAVVDGERDAGTPTRCAAQTVVQGAVVQCEHPAPHIGRPHHAAGCAWNDSGKAELLPQAALAGQEPTDDG